MKWRSLLSLWHRRGSYRALDDRAADQPEEASAAPPEAGPSQLPALSPEVEACVSSFDDGLRAAARAWSSGALVPKVNPLRLQRVRDEMAARDSTALAALIVEIAAPPNAVSAVSAQTAVNNPVRDQFVRGVMGAVIQAIVDVELAHDSAPLAASALLERVRTWIARPQLRQAAGPRTGRQALLEEANENLIRIAGDIEGDGDEQAAAMVRQGIVGPLGIALQIIKQLEETPASVLGLQVAGFEAVTHNMTTDITSDPEDSRRATA